MNKAQKLAIRYQKSFMTDSPWNMRNMLGDEDDECNCGTEKKANVNPKTLLEWRAYVRTLAGVDLRSKTIVANTQKFVDVLRADLSMADIRSVIEAFCQQLVNQEQKIPEGGAFNLIQMARETRQL